MPTLPQQEALPHGEPRRFRIAFAQHDIDELRTKLQTVRWGAPGGILPEDDPKADAGLLPTPETLKSYVKEWQAFDFRKAETELNRSVSKAFSTLPDFIEGSRSYMVCRPYPPTPLSLPPDTTTSLWTLDGARRCTMYIAAHRGATRSHSSSSTGGQDPLSSFCASRTSLPSQVRPRYGLKHAVSVSRKAVLTFIHVHSLFLTM